MCRIHGNLDQGTLQQRGVSHLKSSGHFMYHHVSKVLYSVLHSAFMFLCGHKTKWWSAYAALTDWFCLMAGIPLCYIPSTDERSCVSSELLSWRVYIFINAINGLVLFSERHELNVWIQLMLIFVFLCCLGNRRAFHKEVTFMYRKTKEDLGGLCDRCGQEKRKD